MSKSGLTREDNVKLKQYFEIIEKENIAIPFLAPVDYIALELLDYPDFVKNPMDLGTIKKNIKNGKYSILNDIYSHLDLVWSNCKLYNQAGSEIYIIAQQMEKLSKNTIDKIFNNKKSLNENNLGATASDIKQSSKDNNNNNTSTKNKTNKKSNNTNNKSKEDNNTTTNNNNNKSNKNTSKNNNNNNNTTINANINNINKLEEEKLKTLEKLDNQIKEEENKILSEKNDNKEQDDESEVEDDPNAILPYYDRLKLCERVKKLTNDGLASIVRLIEKQIPRALDDTDKDKLEINLTVLDKRSLDQINALIDTYLKVRETNQENLIIKKAQRLI